MILMAFTYFTAIMIGETMDVEKCMKTKSKSVCKEIKAKEWEW